MFFLVTLRGLSKTLPVNNFPLRSAGLTCVRTHTHSKNTLTFISGLFSSELQNSHMHSMAFPTETDADTCKSHHHKSLLSDLHSAHKKETRQALKKPEIPWLLLKIVQAETTNHDCKLV
ncbi:hypothetical protein ATANTOWER_016052 [Ataeniobius toweri]|uniref:Uncharacterized protein n=1 Tax=Ataeniobius toweri TaxID=208326 RepID=A0ABU7AKH4_9TELE|nr:hypothetical protein [Ataeniobius toweri]